MNKRRYGLVPLALLLVCSTSAIADDTASPASPSAATSASSPADTGPASAGAPAESGAADAGTAGPASPADTGTAGASPASASSSPADTSTAGTDSAAVASPDLFDNRFYLAPMGALALTSQYRHSSNAFGGALAFGKSVVPHLGLEIIGDYLHYKGRDYTVTKTGGLLCGPVLKSCDVTEHQPNQNIYGGGLGANLYLSPSNYGLFVHADAQGGNRFVYNGGLGLDLPFVPHGLTMRAEALYHKENGFRAEPLFQLGVRIPLGKMPAPAPAPEPPVKVVPPVEPPPPPPPPPCEMPAPGERISMEGCKTGDTLVLRGVNFDFDKATLTLNAKALLDQVAEALTTRADIKVELDGHTDSKGSNAYNQKLSQRRADSVEQYLIGKGIDAGRMSTRGFGETMPIADNKTDEGRELNRRVELKVTESNTPASGTDVPVSSGAMESTPPAAAAPAVAAPPAEAAAPADATPPVESAAPPANAPPASP